MCGRLFNKIIADLFLSFVLCLPTSPCSTLCFPALLESIVCHPIPLLLLHLIMLSCHLSFITSFLLILSLLCCSHSISSSLFVLFRSISSIVLLLLLLFLSLNLHFLKLYLTHFFFTCIILNFFQL